jgi:uncharacterized protein YwqG
MPTILLSLQPGETALHQSKIGCMPYEPLRHDKLWRQYLDLSSHRFSDHPEPGYGRNKIGGYHYSQNNQDPRVAKPGWQDST